MPGATSCNAHARAQRSFREKVCVYLLLRVFEWFGIAQGTCSWEMHSGAWLQEGARRVVLRVVAWPEVDAAGKVLLK